MVSTTIQRLATQFWNTTTVLDRKVRLGLRLNSARRKTSSYFGEATGRQPFFLIYLNLPKYRQLPIISRSQPVNYNRRHRSAALVARGTILKVPAPREFLLSINRSDVVPTAAIRLPASTSQCHFGRGCSLWRTACFHPLRPRP